MEHLLFDNCFNGIHVYVVKIIRCHGEIRENAFKVSIEYDGKRPLLDNYMFLTDNGLNIDVKDLLKIIVIPYYSDSCTYEILEKKFVSDTDKCNIIYDLLRKNDSDNDDKLLIKYFFFEENELPGVIETLQKI